MICWFFKFFFLYWKKSHVNQEKIPCFQFPGLLSLYVCVVQSTLMSWNVLPEAVRNVLCYDIFKKKNHTHKNKEQKKEEKKTWQENRLLFQFIFWCLHVAPSKAGGAQRSPRRQCQRMLSPSKCTISLGDLVF